MTRLKTKHVTEAAKPQGRTIVAALVILLVWLAFNSGT